MEVQDLVGAAQATMDGAGGRFALYARWRHSTRSRLESSTLLQLPLPPELEPRS
jgi:hypothetical protein